MGQICKSVSGNGFNPDVMKSSIYLYHHPLKKSSRRQKLLYIKELQLFYKNLGIPSQYAENYISYLKTYWKLENAELVDDKIALSYKLFPILIVDLLGLYGYDMEILQANKFQTALRTMKKISSTSSAVATALLQVLNDPKHNSLNRKMRPVFQRDVTLYPYVDWLACMDQNVQFSIRKSTRILITATMSAGKSTFLNALIGKKISLSQNMACTAKIHRIYSKPFEDNLIGEWDYDFVLDAGKHELYDDNVNNPTDDIYVGTYFNGLLGGERIEIFDTPGVNAYEHPEHAKISQNVIDSGNYDIVICILNATQIGTEDCLEHLKTIKQCCSSKQVLFILNKIDAFTEEDNLEETYHKLKKELDELGFQQPLICPCSAKVGCLMKKQKSECDENELDERDLARRKFKKAPLNLEGFYIKKMGNSYFPKTDDPAEMTLRQCGIRYIERILKTMIRKAEKN